MITKLSNNVPRLYLEITMSDSRKSDDANAKIRQSLATIEKKSKRAIRKTYSFLCDENMRILQIDI